MHILEAYDRVLNTFMKNNDRFSYTIYHFIIGCIKPSHVWFLLRAWLLFDYNSYCSWSVDYTTGWSDWLLFSQLITIAGTRNTTLNTFCFQSSFVYTYYYICRGTEKIKIYCCRHCGDCKSKHKKILILCNSLVKWLLLFRVAIAI